METTGVRPRSRVALISALTLVVEGLWRIVMDVDKQRHTQEFEVREFVLPKFEATLKTPGFLSYNRRNDQTVQKVIINVCAK